MKNISNSYTLSYRARDNCIIHDIKPEENYASNITTQLNRSRIPRSRITYIRKYYAPRKKNEALIRFFLQDLRIDSYYDTKIKDSHMDIQQRKNHS